MLAGCAGAPVTETAVVKTITGIGPKKRVAVVDFEVKSRYGRSRLGQAAADILVTELVKTQQFIVVERDKLKLLMDEQSLGMSGVVDPKTAAKAGKVLGLNAIVTGSVSETGVKTTGTDIGIYKRKTQTANVTVDVRVVNATTGRIILADTGKGVAETTTKEYVGLGDRASHDETLADNALRAAIVQLLDNIIQQMIETEWSGRVAQVEGNVLYVNAGRETGLEVGDVLNVYRPGKEIKDPSTGLSLGFTENLIGQATVTGFFGQDGSTTVPNSGIGFNVNDIVRLKK
jgi:curli biogenesis system outer membrane secretion channel CsgG